MEGCKEKLGRYLVFRFKKMMNKYRKSHLTNKIKFKTT